MECLFWVSIRLSDVLNLLESQYSSCLLNEWQANTAASDILFHVKHDVTFDTLASLLRFVLRKKDSAFYVTRSADFLYL